MQWVLSIIIDTQALCAKVVVEDLLIHCKNDYFPFFQQETLKLMCQIYIPLFYC